MSHISLPFPRRTATATTKAALAQFRGVADLATGDMRCVPTGSKRSRHPWDRACPVSAAIRFRFTFSLQT